MVSYGMPDALAIITMQNELTEQERICIIDGAAGIYVPMRFYEDFDFDSWGLDPNDYRGCSHPDNEDYWDDWDRLLVNAQHQNKDGEVWRLEQDGDLFAVKDVES